MPLNAAAAKYVVTKEPALPGTCIGCNTAGNGRTEFVDLAASIDYYGAILLCVNCAKEVANLVGFFSEQMVIRERLELTEAKSERDKALKKVEALESMVNAYGISNFDPPGSSSESSVDSSETEEQRDKVPEKPKSGLFE